MNPKKTAMNSGLRKTVSLVVVMIGCALYAPAKAAADDFSLVLTMVTGEHSKDSNSTTTRVSVATDKLVYQQSWHGAHSHGRTPVRKEYALTSEDRIALIKVLREADLLANRTLSGLSEEEANLYFSLVIQAKLDGRENLISIKGPRGAKKLKEDRLYQNSLLLVKQLYQIINRSDASISMPGLVY